MSDKQTQGESNDGQEADSAAIFAAEVAALTGGGDQGRSVTDGGVVTGEGTLQADAGSSEAEANQGSVSDSGGDSTGKGGAQGSAQEDSGAGETLETGEEGQAQESDSVRKQRNDWKREAIESRQAIKEMQEQMKALSAKLEAPSDKPNQSGEPVKIPEIRVEDLDLPQETKDLLEYTPGLDKLIQSLAAETAKAIIENKDSERQAKQVEEASSREAEAKEQEFWTNVDNWLQGEYPELSLSDIRSSPDFNDWLDYRKNWVDAQLGAVDRTDTSGAQKVYERYIIENGLAESNSDGADKSNRRLASARSPSMGTKTTRPQGGEVNIFAKEVEQLKARNTLNRQFV